MTVRCYDLYPVRPKNPQRDAYLIANRGVDPFLLAQELGVTERYIRTQQLRLRLRVARNPRDKE